MSTLFTINPSRRRRSGKKRRSAKQRAATRRMLAANRGRFASNPKKRRARRRSRKSVSIVARTIRRTRRAGRKAMRAYRRRGRSRSMRLNTGNMVNLLKAGAIGGAGAVLVDIGMTQIARFLPAPLATPMDASGNVQYGYFGAKAGLALLLATYGGKVIPGTIAEKMGEGALTVLAYQFIRPMVPAALGYFNPAPTMRPQIGRAGAYVAGMGAYPALPVRANGANAKGGRAANVLNMVNVQRRPA
jgi:hypothetical protein